MRGRVRPRPGPGDALIRVTLTTICGMCPANGELEIMTAERDEAGHPLEWRPKKIRITAGNIQATASLNESATAEAIWSALPIEASGSTWGDEIYFGIAVKAAAVDRLIPA